MAEIVSPDWRPRIACELRRASGVLLRNEISALEAVTA